MRTWRRAATSALLVTFVSGLAVPSQAQADGTVTFGVRPASAEAPDTRSDFSYNATPGGVLRDHVAVSNIATEPVTLRVYAGDAFNTPEGGFDLLADREPVDVGKWAVPDTDQVTVEPRSTVVVPFTLTIPLDATPGDHSGGIVASYTTESQDADGQRIAVEQRVGARVHLRVSGDLRPELRIEELTADYRGPLAGLGTTKVSYLVRNTGNVRLGGKQSVRVETPWGSAVDGPALADLPELLPGNTFRVATEVPGLLPAGWLTAGVHVDPIAPPGTEPAPSAVEASVTTAAVPWLSVIVTGLLVGLLLLRRWRRGRRPSAVEPVRRHDRVAA